MLSRVRAQFQDQNAPLLMEFRGLTKYVPLVFTGGFFVLCMLLSAVGPIDWQMPNPFAVYGYCLGAVGLLVAGYVTAMRWGSQSTQPTPLQASVIVIAGGIAFWIIYPFLVHTMTGKWYPDVWTGVTNAGLAYDTKIELSESASQTWTYVSFLVAPLTVPLLPLTLFFWPRLTLLARFLGVSTVVATVGFGIAQATNKNVAEICAYLILFLVLLAGGSRGRHAWRRVVLCGVAAALIASAFFVYYTASITSRLQDDVVDALSSQQTSPTPAPDDAESTEPSPAPSPAEKPAQRAKGDRAKDPTSGKGSTSQPRSPTASPTASGTPTPVPLPDTEETEELTDSALEQSSLLNTGVPREDSAFFAVVPAALEPTSVKLASYLTQGFKGLSMSMEKPWKPTWGLGFSDLVRHNVARIYGGERLEERVIARTYVGRLEVENAWPAGQRWSSFFVHPANDIGFPGTLVLMFLIGATFGLAWKDMLFRRDPLACVVAFHLCILVFYLNANNQLFQGGQLAIGFSTVLLGWLVLRLRPSRTAA